MEFNPKDTIIIKTQEEKGFEIKEIEITLIDFIDMLDAIQSQADRRKTRMSLDKKDKGKTGIKNR